MKPHEDWVNGSWTVDCVCGVNFDDGKEMVNCDECGVWVHTFCSRYIKGDDQFSCHKCIIKTHEIEIAPPPVSSKFLVTKTMRMENLTNQSQMETLNRGFRVCKEIPIEDRVHVQGVPGGNLEHFPSIFSRQLWKCTGYVPKKFKFKYCEFPEEEDTCYRVLSKENDLASSAIGANEEKLGVEDIRRCGSGETEMKRYNEDLEDRVRKRVRVSEKDDEN